MKPRRPPTFARQGGTKVHVVDEARKLAGYAMSVCGAELHGPEYLARQVPEPDRCQAGACRRRWPAHLRAVG